MITLAGIITDFEADFLSKYGQRLLPSQHKALGAMKHCRTKLAAQMLAQCSDCGSQRLVPHSCGHRNCPHCQHFEGQRWIERQTGGLVPANYFLITFTLPSELRALAWTHQTSVYAALIECAWATLREFSQNHKHLQGLAGALAVLHTQSRRLEFHPHVHLVMPAAALDLKHGLWRTLRRRGKTQGNGYLFNHKALAKVFRAKFLAALSAAGLAPPPGVTQTWVVDCKGVGDGSKALVYLGKYLYRGVIAEKDIVGVKEGRVSFRYRDSRTGKTVLCTLAGADFLWLVLQHVLPKGFRRSRNFGFLHPNCKRRMALVRLALRMPTRPHTGVLAPAQTPPATPRPVLRCQCCGAAMVIVRRRIAARGPETERQRSGAGQHEGAIR